MASNAAEANVESLIPCFIFFGLLWHLLAFLQSPYFLPDQHNTGIKFYQIHHNIPIKSGAGGLISMPSFHVIWAILCQQSTWHIRWLWCLLLPVNILVILAALVLGWHYLVDILAALLIVIIAYYVKIFSRHRLNPDTN